MHEGGHNLLEGTLFVGGTLFMLQTDCKLDQFVNGPPVYKPVNRLINWLARFQLYKAKWSRL